MHLMHGNGVTLSWKESHMNQNNVDIRYLDPSMLVV